MTRLLCITFLSAFSAAMTGCAYVEEKFQDVSNNPKFAVSYRQGEVYRLRTDGRIIAIPDARRPNTKERLELWSPKLMAKYAQLSNDYRFVAIAAAGSIVHVDGLEHNYTFAIPPVPGDSQILRAYGTVESNTGRWTDVRIPDDQTANWSFVPGTYVMAFPPDHGFLELVAPATKVAHRPVPPARR
jgi:hypothetical protein